MQGKPNEIPDHIAQMIDRLRAERTIDEPLFVSAASVFYEGIDDLTVEEMNRLEAAGFEAVRNEGEPREIRVPSVVRMIETGRPYDHVEIDPEDRPKVMFLGFAAIAAETLMHEEQER